MTTDIPVRWGPLEERLRCPECGLILAPNTPDSEVSCPTGHRFPVRDGYLDFSGKAPFGGTTEQTFDSFGYEWNSFGDVREEDEKFAEIYFADVDLGDLAGKFGLDAGCGKGRFTRILARHLEGVVALDGSRAVEAAARNLAPMSNVVVIRSDLRCAPLAPGSFDFVSSLGVLHHLDDPQDGFRRLVDYLAPGGQLLLYLYSRPESVNIRSLALATATAVRRLTVRMPHPWLKKLAAPLATLLYAGLVIPGRWGDEHGIRRLEALPMDTYRDKPLRSLVLDTFDRLSAPVEHRYVWAELAPWFDQAGLVVDAARDQTGWFVTAHRP